MASKRTLTDKDKLPSRESVASLVQLPFDAEGLNDVQETAWMEVISKMEEVYATLVQDEVELEEKNAELSDAQRFITSVLAAMSDLLIVCDRSGAILQVNTAVSKLTGLTEDELIGRKLDTLLAPAEEGGAAVSAMTETCESEARLVTHDGVSELMSLSCTSRLDRRGRAAGKVVTARPIGELRRAYAALESAHTDLQQSQQRMIHAEKLASLGRLVAGVAHELNNPIGFIHANVHALTKYADRLQTYLQAIHTTDQGADVDRLRQELRIDDLLSDLKPLIEGTLEGADRARDIVKGLRRMSFSGSEPPSRINVSDMMGSALTWARRGSKQTIESHIRLDPGLFIVGRESQIQQVALNIIQNALDAMKAEDFPLIEIESRRVDDRVVVTFRDHGPGIAEENSSKIFEPFFTTKEIGDGTGLGLWMSFDIVKAHDGDLSAYNHAEGGCVFELTLPLAGD